MSQNQSDATIEVSGVGRTYVRGKKSVQALSGIDLSIRQGEFVTLFGPSGCGKSTLLRMIVGLEDITDGELRIDDRVVNDKAPKDRNLAMVFQNYALYP
ncbi:MAG TPA: ABC transporter ATP-binding protein, partial [Microbacterium sp.]|nr:ABC transporter ATP-binding protein [Microbacterium sp.]